jgi:hypothetical protein
MIPFFYFILQINERTIIVGAFSWYLESGSKKLVLLALALD